MLSEHALGGQGVARRAGGHERHQRLRTNCWRSAQRLRCAVDTADRGRTTVRSCTGRHATACRRQPRVLPGFCQPRLTGVAFRRMRMAETAAFSTVDAVDRPIQQVRFIVAPRDSGHSRHGHGDHGGLVLAREFQQQRLPWRPRHRREPPPPRPRGPGALVPRRSLWLELTRAAYRL